MTKRKKLKKVKTRPNYLQRDFWNSVNGLGGGQWGDGFVAGVIALTRFMNRKKAIIEISYPSQRSKKINK